MLFMSCVCHVSESVHDSFVVTWKERADLLALVCDVYVIFPIWYPVTGMEFDCIDS